MQITAATQLFNGLWPAAPQGLTITNVVTDSREVSPGCVFVAIKGARADGHNFAAGAIQNGAAAAVLQHPVSGVPADRTVLVADPLDAMIALGGNYRGLFNPLIVGVTGSVGKTTTKEFCAAVLQTFGSTIKTEGNQNNEIGMPKTLFRISGQTSYAVVEMGMQALGEIRKLTLAARPSAGIITKIGTSHMESLGSVKNIRRAKLEICEGLPPGAPLVLNGDDEMLCGAPLPTGLHVVYAGLQAQRNEVQGVDIRRDGQGTRFAIQDARYGRHEVYIPTIGRHHVQDALLAFAAVTRLGLNAAQAAAALSQYRPAGMRQNIVRVGGVSVVEDCYNANPDSMAAALAALGEMEVAGSRVAVLGNMLELGTIAPTAHQKLAALCAENGVAHLITVGKLAALAVPPAQKLGIQAHPCESNAQAAALLAKTAKSGDAVLLKASRGMKFEEILQEYRATVESQPCQRTN